VSADTDADRLVATIRDELRAAADPERAVGQRAYMKSTLPFLGVRLPETRRIARAAAKDADDAMLKRAVHNLWDRVTFREEWYAAMALLACANVELSQTEEIERMVRTGRWWDITDELAHRAADLHDAFPRETAEVVRRWSMDPDFWVRREAILSQLGRRDRLDRALLAEVIEPSLGDAEFFVRKAIGWALREYARVEPDWVREYARTPNLSPLSRREALKHLGGPE
jgi:3-methyladenine DNA glycosylase AlkD